MPALSTYRRGTHRLVPPETTLARITPLLRQCGITWCTSVTQLDGLGIPTYCAIRPDALTVQVSNGKGPTDVSARVSALMEGLELHHAEHPLPERLRRTCVEELRREGAEFLWPPDLPEFYGGYFGARFQCDWVSGQDLVTGHTIWAPASAVYFLRTPGLYNTTSNGLASGNHLAEATLHALYEVIERDARARLSVDGKVRLHGRAHVIDGPSVDVPELRDMLRRVDADQTKVVLLWLRSVVPVHTFLTILLNRKALVATSRANMGAGTHADRQVAASRALTEAAQSRLTFIHGGRDDLLGKIEHPKNAHVDSVYRFFDRLTPDTTWAMLDEEPVLTVESNLESQLGHLVAALAQAGHAPVARFDLTRSEIGVPVVKVVVPTLRCNLGRSE